MRTYTITRTVYKFDELPDAVKQKALDQLRDINVDYNWWDCIYENAVEVSLKITSFDIDHRFEIDGKWTMNALNTAEMIVENHGNACKTYQDAMTFLCDYAKAQMEYENDGYPDFENTVKHNILCGDFQRVILEDYWQILYDEYNYLTSDEVIIETIKANEHEFTAEGRLDGDK